MRHIGRREPPMLSMAALMIFLKERRLTQRRGAKGARVSGRKKPRQHMADMILAAEKDRQDADPLFRFVQFEPVDSSIDRQMSQTRQQIIMTLTPIWRRTQPVGLLPDLADAVLAMIQCRFNAFAEASVAFEQVVEDQGKITLGFRRELNSEPHVRGASQ